MRKHGSVILYNRHSISIHLGHVCFQEFTFLETIFLTFQCLVNTWKVSQRKLNSSQRKMLTWCRESVFRFLFLENTFLSFHLKQISRSLYNWSLQKINLRGCWLSPFLISYYWNKDHLQVIIFLKYLYIICFFFLFFIWIFNWDCEILWAC